MNQEKEIAEFINSIIEDANSGRTFVPFIGSGLSSPSGIIMGMEFTNYLAFTTYLVLCQPLKRERTHGEGAAMHWDLSGQGWPPLPSSNEVQRAKIWVRTKFENDICKRLGFSILEEAGDVRTLTKAGRGRSTLDDLVSSLGQPPIPMILRAGSASDDEERLKQFKKTFGRNLGSGLGPSVHHWMHAELSYSDAIIEAGVRALADWRETLSFLASVRVDRNRTPRLAIGELNPSIIDDFNSTITRDKRPNLGHKIISHLAEPLRISTLLTTNFDTLMEDAYRAMSQPLTVLPVSSKGDLPHPRTVNSCDALVKLHGESHDTRADLSLDQEPSDEDKSTFCAYMQRGSGNLLRNRHIVRKSRYRSSRLLVVGYSGSDHRCVQMIKHWLESAEDNPRIYWVCFSEWDVRRVKALFASSSYDGKIKTVLTPRPDLLLYELYQRLVLALPPGGLTYEFSHVLPPRRSNQYDSAEQDVDHACTIAAGGTEHAELLANNSRRTLRDAAVRTNVLNIMAAVNNAPGTQSIFGTARAWGPDYRLDRGELYGEAVRSFAFHPRVINSSGGIVRASALAAAKLSTEQYRKVFWIELQDYLDGDSLLRDLLRSIALRFGQFQTRHVTMHPISDGIPTKGDDCTESIKRLSQHLRAVLREYRVDPESLVIMFCGRDSYGNGAGLIASSWGDSSDNFWQLHLLIEVLACVGVPTIYFPCTEGRSKRKTELIRSLKPVRGGGHPVMRIAPKSRAAQRLWLSRLADRRGSPSYCCC